MGSCRLFMATGHEGRARAVARSGWLRGWGGRPRGSTGGAESWGAQSQGPGGVPRRMCGSRLRPLSAVEFVRRVMARGPREVTCDESRGSLGVGM